MYNEFEIITHHQISHFRVFLVNLLYRTPHLHKDYEICLILEGSLSFYANNQTYEVAAGDFLLVNPYQVHELKAQEYALILSVQVSPAFFQSYYPQINSMFFSICHLMEQAFPGIYQPLYQAMTHLASAYFEKKDGYELDCAAKVNHIFSLLVSSCPYQIRSEKEHSSARIRQKRIRDIIDYIDENYAQKLLLTDIAEKENLTVTYLSHFFKDTFGISFQEYLMRIRCEKARHLLLLTDQSLLDISMACGFSDPKYFNSGFLKQFGYSPKEYRKHFAHEDLPVQQKSILTTQKFLSDSASVVMLQKYRIL